MDGTKLPHNAALVAIRHPVDGDAENGRVLCNEVLKRLEGHAGPVCIFHDAQDMVSADNGYAEEFKRLDGMLAGRVLDTVCVIPQLLPRIMALTVAKVSTGQWHIFRTWEDAAAHLRDAGAVPEQKKMYAGSVSVSKLARAA